MAKFCQAFTALLIAISGVMAAFKQPCQAPYDVCGWQIAGGNYGYDVADLQVAAADAGQDTAIAWDSIYNCDDNGQITWSIHCGGGGTCNAGIDGRTDATCRDDQGSGEVEEGDEGQEAPVEEEPIEDVPIEEEEAEN